MEDIVIVGRGAVLPGCNTIDDFWQATLNKLDLRQEIEVREHPWQQFVAPQPAEYPLSLDQIPHGHAYPVESHRLRVDNDICDLSCAMALRASEQALADCAWESVARQRAAVILGSIVLPTQRSSRHRESDRFQEPLDYKTAREALVASEPAQHLARHWQFCQSKSFCLDAACASSLYALKFAVDALQSGSLDMVLAGGVAGADTLFTQMGFAQLQALSRQGQVRPFDEDADGLLVGQGAAIFVLKRRSDAIASGDRIYAVIKGIGLSNDKAGPLMAPAQEGQLRAMKQAYHDAEISPATIEYIECHGTGTPLGDKTELTSLSELLAGENNLSQPIAIGSAKSNVGHLLTAAGAVGVLRILLAMERKILPPTANFDHSRLLDQQSRLQILSEPRPWSTSASDKPRRAAVSAFGFGGTNAHIILEEASAQRLHDVGLQSKVKNIRMHKRFAVVAASSYFGEQDSGHWPDFAIPIRQFRIPPRELRQMLPQQLAMLLTAQDALRRTNFDKIDEDRAGVFIGVELDQNTHAFGRRWQAQVAETDVPGLSADRVLGSLASVIASRISRQFRFGGPSITEAAGYQTASVLLDSALRLLERGDIDLAVVGAVDQASDPFLASVRKLMAEGAPVPSGRDAAIAMVIKPLELALRDQDKILASFERGPAIADDGYLKEGRHAALRYGVAAGFAELFESLELAATSPNKLLSWDAFVFQPQQLGALPAVTLSVSDQKSQLRIDAKPWLRYDSPKTQEPGSRSGASGGESRSQPLSARLLSALLKDAEISQAAMAEAHAQHQALQLQSLGFMQQLMHSLSMSADESGGGFPAPQMANARALDHGSEVSAPESLSSPQVIADKKPVPLFDWQACHEFAVGKIEKVFGSEFAAVDTFPSRVRLPSDELLLCHRVMALQGEAKSLGPGALVTEHDVSSGAWYLDNGRIPTAIAIEAGQADLMLSAWLGADFATEGRAYYRLLDAQVRFFDCLPAVGAVIRYHIKIQNFFKQGETLLFRFGFDAYVGERKLMQMTDGCAGFFTPAELSAGKGIVKAMFKNRPRVGAYVGGFVPLFAFAGEHYDEAALDRLRDGDLAGCFGPQFAHLPLQTPLTIPSGHLRLVHRIVQMDSAGGWFHKGLVIGEADIDPQAWFLTCHFKDDPVMPGTLMYECCLQTLRVFVLRMGLIGECDQVECRPKLGEASQLKCRGQVLETTKQVRYELHVREMGYGPDLFLLVDALMYADERLIVDISNMTLEFSGMQKASIDALWHEHHQQTEATPAQKLSNEEAIAEVDQQCLLFDEDQVLEFSSGQPSRAFGEAFQVFDQERFLARLPRPPYSFLNGIAQVSHPPMQLVAPQSALGVYWPHKELWFVTADGEQAPHGMPYAILLEAGLQTCGWLSAYMGSALESEHELFYRNLEGSGTHHQRVNVAGGALQTKAQCVAIAKSGGMIIQKFRFETRQDDDLVYEAETSFGFFSKSSLEAQRGLTKPVVADLPKPDRWLDPLIPLARARQPWRMFDRLHPVAEDKGLFGDGRFVANLTIDPQAWYFHAHFLDDPVMPGSLGLEMLLQALREIAVLRFGGGLWELAPASKQHWSYRGQVRPHNRQVICDIHPDFGHSDKNRLVATAVLWVDSMPIYQMDKFCIARLDGS